MGKGENMKNLIDRNESQVDALKQELAELEAELNRLYQKKLDQENGDDVIHNREQELPTHALNALRALEMENIRMRKTRDEMHAENQRLRKKCAELKVEVED